jgi:hypothetical protein
MANYKKSPAIWLIKMMRSKKAMINGFLLALIVAAIVILLWLIFSGKLLEFAQNVQDRFKGYIQQKTCDKSSDPICRDKEKGVVLGQWDFCVRQYGEESNIGSCQPISAESNQCLLSCGKFDGSNFEESEASKISRCDKANAWAVTFNECHGKGSDCFINGHGWTQPAACHWCGAATSCDELNDDKDQCANKECTSLFYWECSYKNNKCEAAAYIGGQGTSGGGGGGGSGAGAG